MVQRKAYILKSSEDGRRHVCIDKETENEIFNFLKEDHIRVQKFNQVVDLILRNLRNSDLYGRENIDEKTKRVTAIKMFKRGQNIRIYCKEQSSINGMFYVIAANLVKKKKDQKVRGKIKNLIETIAGYEYEIINRE